MCLPTRVHAAGGGANGRVAPIDEGGGPVWDGALQHGVSQISPLPSPLSPLPLSPSPLSIYTTAYVHSRAVVFVFLYY